MNAYLFTGWISQFQRGHLVDSCSNLIVCGADNQVAAQQFLEQCLLSPNTAEEPTPTKVERVVGAPLLDQLLTETGPGPLNWEEIVAEAQKDWESSELDDSELGYWLDCNPYVEPSRLAADIEQLRKSLPEDLRSGLNWKPEKARFFLVSVLCPPPPPAPEVWEGEDSGRRLEPGDEQEEVGNLDLVERQAAFPELAEKEQAVLVRARNALVAAWLCRKQTSPDLASRAIRIDAWCGAVPFPK